MTAYRLVDDGYSTFKKIMCGRKWVGRVCLNANGGGYFARIKMAKGPDVEFVGATEREAFDECAARALGAPNVAALRAPQCGRARRQPRPRGPDARGDRRDGRRRLLRRRAPAEDVREKKP